MNCLLKSKLQILKQACNDFWNYLMTQTTAFGVATYGKGIKTIDLENKTLKRFSYTKQNPKVLFTTN